MSFTDKQLADLKAPLNKAHVKQRSQAGRSLSYIEGWHAIDEANRIFGYDKWLRLTEELRPVCEPYQDQKGNWRVGYMARVRIVVEHDSGELMRDGCGYGSGIDRDLGSAHESALKEAETDAMKRALMTFGNPFGLALYDKEQKNVANEPPADAPTDSQKLIFAALGLGMEKAASTDELELFKVEQIKPQLDALTAAQQADIQALYKDRYRSLGRRAA